MMQNVRRYIAFYEKDGPEKEGEIPLPEIDVTALAEIVTPKKSDPLFYDPYFINEDAAKVLFSKYNIVIRTSDYDYYIEAEAI